MSKGKRQDLPPLVPSEGSVFPKEPEDESPAEEVTPALPAGLKELPQPGASLKAAQEAALKDGWTPQEGGFWSNNREFNIPGGVVPQGVVRDTKEAHALEMQRR